MRHAKSSWAEPGLADFDRPLNDRGLRDAPFMGSVMKANGYQPDIVLSSPAVRAKTTAVLACEGGEFGLEPKFDERIYEASPQALMQVISEIQNGLNRAMVVGHNPGTEGFVRYLTGKAEPMPTAAVAVVELTIEDWRSVSPGTGRLAAIFRPKDEMRPPGTVT